MNKRSLFRKIFHHRQGEVDLAFKKAKAFGSCYGIKILKAEQDPELDYSTFLILPTRQIKGAVKRNLLRRRIKYIIYTEELYKIASRGNYIILLYPNIMTFSKINRYMREAFKNIGN